MPNMQCTKQILFIGNKNTMVNVKPALWEKALETAKKRGEKLEDKLSAFLIEYGGKYVIQVQGHNIRIKESK